ncbi:hypothetical protein DNK48_35120 [Streptomyces malaysiensis subsp. malaysiensis]|nr:hypothetical protein DNK48_35120 [Streptomyces malaysiensis]
MLAVTLPFVDSLEQPERPTSAPSPPPPQLFSRAAVAASCVGFVLIGALQARTIRSVRHLTSRSGHQLTPRVSVCSRARWLGTYKRSPCDGLAPRTSTKQNCYGWWRPRRRRLLPVFQKACAAGTNQGIRPAPAKPPPPHCKGPPAAL